MLKAPIWRITSKHDINTLLDILTYRQVKIITDWKLLAKIWVEWSTMHIAESLKIRLDGKVGAAKVTISV